MSTGPREGRKVFTLQTLPPDPERSNANVAEASGFSLHAGAAAKGAERVLRYTKRRVEFCAMSLMKDLNQFNLAMVNDPELSVL